ncbi:tectonin 2 [Paramuricea clavata]|uniref:Tectonin 2 n=1 Tax=Paramuricea clavata TaxID=317549 RepID=A0A6S7J2A1_PARCT|nr:tectonin 2 [Paramuricea clavata]
MKRICLNRVLFLFCVCILGCHEAHAICGGEKEQRFIKISQDGLAEVNPFNRTTVASNVLCSFDCASRLPCWSFVYLKQATTENCLLSRDANGGSSSEDSETFIGTTKRPNIDEAVCDHDKCQRGSKCIACSSDSYECECPPWASGRLCQNLNPDYNQSLLPWKRGRGYGIVTVDIAFNIAWCTTSDHKIFINVNGRDGTWVNVGGRLSQISIGESGVWGVYTTGAIYYRGGKTASNPSGTVWYLNIGLLIKITSGPPGKQN